MTTPESLLARLTEAKADLAQAERLYRSRRLAISKELRAWRFSHKVSLRTIAKRMHVSAPYVSDLELGRMNWHADLMQRYAAAVLADSE